jgi:hypothetical protein
MKRAMNIETTTPSFLTRLSHFARYHWQVFVALGFLALSPTAQPVVPPPDGGYPGGNTAEGQDALSSLTTGTFNTAVGFFSIETVTTGNFNTAVGAGTLLANTADQNTATGAGALLSNTIGIGNTADGTFALFSNTEGNQNTANGLSALQSNILGAGNTADGALALFSNTEGNNNTATGLRALRGNTTGENNTAIGADALDSNTTGIGNTAIGSTALGGNATGNSNTAVGDSALASPLGKTGSGNTAVGNRALFAPFDGPGDNNTAVGTGAGANLGESDSNNIDIGANVNGVAGESNTIRIGNDDITGAFIKGISGATVVSGATVLVGANGHLGTATSSKRFKEEIKPMDKASEALFLLKPVTFRYKKEIDPAGTSQFGLVAEEVEKINPDLVVRDEKGEINTVRYDQVNAMLLNEFLKEHRKVQEEEATIAELKSIAAQQQQNFAQQQAQIEALETGLQKVKAQVEMKNPVPRVAANEP